MSRILIDTSAYVSHLRHHPAVKDALQRAAEVLVNPIVLGELHAGFLKGSKARQNEERLQDFLDSPRVEVVPVDEETSVRYGAIHDYLRRAGTPIPVNDLWIAASAAQYGLRLLTLDEHFTRVPQILVDYVETPPA